MIINIFLQFDKDKRLQRQQKSADSQKARKQIASQVFFIERHQVRFFSSEPDREGQAQRCDQSASKEPNAHLILALKTSGRSSQRRFSSLITQLLLKSCTSRSWMFLANSS